MEFTFQYQTYSTTKKDESDIIEVTIDVTSDGDDYNYEISSLYSVDLDKIIQLEALPNSEVKEIEDLAEKLAYEKGPEAYQSYLESKADFDYECYRDSLME